jgi:hypothetical protein
MEAHMPFLRPIVATAALCLLVSACATGGVGGGGEVRGTTGDVAWEVADIGQIVSVDSQRIRWSYVIILRNTGDMKVEIERLERSLVDRRAGTFIGAATASQPLRRTLRARSEVRVPVSDDWGWTLGTTSRTTFGGTADLPPITVIRRLLGTDEKSNAVDISVRVNLDRGVGRLSKPLAPPEQLPSSKPLQTSDLASLAGKWRGSYRGDRAIFNIPLEVTVSPDGTFQAGENDPVTNRFNGTLRIQDGGVQYSQRRDTGTLTFYEAGGKRMLVGRVSGPRDDGTFSYAVYLETEATATR